MGEIGKAIPVKLVCGLIAAGEDRLRGATGRLAELFGPVDLRSDVFPFDSTDYYDAEMGRGLLRQFVSFERLIDPGELAAIKCRTNALEEAWAEGPAASRRRTVNLDPGYITPAKLVLATTKDFSHRIYLGGGIYAEVTLNFRKGCFRYFEWTYPDFKAGRYDGFLVETRRRVMAAQSLGPAQGGCQALAIQ